MAVRYTCSMQLRVMSWNLNCFTRGQRDAKVRLLQELEWDVVALQECDQKTFELLRTESGADDGIEALAITPSSLSANHHGCALLVRGGAVADARVWPSDPYDPVHPEQPFPERCLAARVTLPDGELTAVSFHAPHAAAGSDEERIWRVARKNAAYRELVVGLASVEGTTVVGMDANAWTDPIDLHPPDPDEEQLDVISFHLADPPHELRDALRVWLDAHPDELERIRRLRPEGTLAVTYDRGKKGRPVVCRMDRIFVSGDLDVISVEHDLGEALAVGGDHAIVRAEVRSR